MRRIVGVAVVLVAVCGVPSGASAQAVPEHCAPPGLGDFEAVECAVLIAACPSIEDPNDPPFDYARTTTCSLGPVTCVVFWRQSGSANFERSYDCDVDGGAAKASCRYDFDGGGTSHPFSSESRNCELTAGDLVLTAGCREDSSAGGGSFFEAQECSSGPSR